jgi:hypothetical protein
MVKRTNIARNFENDTLVDESIFIEDNARPVCMWIYQDSLYDCLSRAFETFRP